MIRRNFLLESDFCPGGLNLKASRKENGMQGGTDGESGIKIPELWSRRSFSLVEDTVRLKWI
jgi:hypothetical protein